jgi:hypothetical protein
MTINMPQFVPGIAISAVPAAAMDGHSYVLSWKGGCADAGIYWPRARQATTGRRWTPTSGRTTTSSRALAHRLPPLSPGFNGRIYLAWKGEGNDLELYLSSHDSLLSASDYWSPQLRVPRIVGTSDGPALAATTAALFLAWKAEADPGDQRIFWSRCTDGSNWSSQQLVNGVGGTSAALALATEMCQGRSTFPCARPWGRTASPHFLPRKGESPQRRAATTPQPTRSPFS